MDAVWDAIRSHRDLALKYWGSGAELMSLLAEEEIYVTEGWSGRIAALQEQGHDIGYYDPPNGFGWQECLFVIKGSPVEACEELLNFMLAPETLHRRGRRAELSARTRWHQGRSGHQDPDIARL